MTYYKEIAPKIIEILLKNGGQKKTVLCALCGCSSPTIQRAAAYLRENGVPIRFNRADMIWEIPRSKQLSDINLFNLVNLGIIEFGQAHLLAFSFHKMLKSKNEKKIQAIRL